ncbi:MULTISPECIES: hypothetical protein [unclassified Cobetia]|uniref:hypothetical protein n=1 Tax=unclassified Cobetia TaxID=2609414 RepID=UPI00178C8517|nr:MULTISPECIES: hypothetical protein [unclassified Cobetia]MBE2167758.1 hypothetical protein [Cobetia sp. 2AS1]MDH2446180.1 hypothetical protein [Cobetia sp. 2AS]
MTVKNIYKTAASLLLLATFNAYGASSERGDLVDDCVKNSNGEYPHDIAPACEATDVFLEAFNAVDEKALSETLNYPHVRISGGNVHVWQKPEDYASDQNKSSLKAIGWKESRWDYRNVIQSGMDGDTGEMKYHVSLSFTRYDEQGNNIPGQTFDSFYIVTKQDGNWGIAARSSMAGSLQGRSGF